jgi:hypothetical protein
MEPAITFNDLSNFEGQIRVCEKSGDLSLYHYRAVDENSNPLLKQVRGVVFNDEGKLIMRGFPYTPEYTHDDPDLNQKIGQVCKYTVIPSFEGTVLRVFFYKDKWFVSTHRKLSASESFWANRDLSFEDQFRQTIDGMLQVPVSPLKTYMQQKGQTVFNYETFFECLDKSKQYMFLINPYGKNRIVSSYGNILGVLHVGTFIDDRFTFTEENIGIPIPQILHFNTVEELSTCVAGMSPVHTQGVLLMSPGGFIKVVSKMYSFLHQIRGNCPNLCLRYLELSRSPQELQVFLQLYPEFSEQFKDIDKRLVSLVKTIHNAYVRRYVQRELTFLPKPRFMFMHKVHDTYLKTQVKTTLQRVQELLTKEDPLSVYRMIRC